MARYVAKPVSRKATITQAQAVAAVRRYRADHDRNITVHVADREPVAASPLDHRRARGM